MNSELNCSFAGPHFNPYGKKRIKYSIKTKLDSLFVSRHVTWPTGS